MRDFATEIEPGTIRFERHMPGPIPRIWDYLTHPTIRGRWLATGPMDLKAGGKFEMTLRPDELTPHAEVPPEGTSPKGVVLRGEVTNCKFPNMLAFTWEPGGPDSVVSFELTQVQGQVRVTLVNSGLKDRAAQIEAAAAWHAHLNVLEAKSNGVVPPPFYKRVAMYEAEYTKRFGSHD